MVMISKISSNVISTGSSAGKKVCKRSSLPTVSGLALLAGSSMSGYNAPSNAGPHEPGTSVDDSLWDQIKHVGSEVKDTGEEILNGILDFIDDMT